MPGVNTERYEKERAKYYKEVISNLTEALGDDSSGIDFNDKKLIKDIGRCLSFRQVEGKIREMFNYAQMKEIAATLSPASKLTKNDVMRALLLPIYKETTSSLDDGEITLISYLSTIPYYTQDLRLIKEATKEGEYKIDNFEYALTGVVMKGIFLHHWEIYCLVGFKTLGRRR